MSSDTTPVRVSQEEKISEQVANKLMPIPTYKREETPSGLRTRGTSHSRTATKESIDLIDQYFVSIFKFIFKKENNS
jgi:hypothetical protein